ncbi:MAG: hypothetical protein O7C63_04980, partial [Alphaproteobacteria bacterium]|nr:hypothetical protein [Alphaproteobacteria bacterium]
PPQPARLDHKVDNLPYPLPVLDRGHDEGPVSSHFFGIPEHDGQVGTASRGFATTDLMYHPRPREMTQRRRCVIFVYIGNEGTNEIGFPELMGTPKPADGHLDRSQH